MEEAEEVVVLLGEKDPRWKICGVDVTLLELFEKTIVESQEAKSRLSPYFLHYRYYSMTGTVTNIPKRTGDCHPLKQISPCHRGNCVPTRLLTFSTSIIYSYPNGHKCMLHNK